MLFLLLVSLSWFIAAQAESKKDYIGWLTIVQYSLTFLVSVVVYRYNLLTHQQLLVTAVIALILLLPVYHYTSNDMQRYLFDGAMLLEGTDPYRENHNSQTAERLKQQWKTPLEHSKYPTLYPPAALALFALAATSGAENTIWVWKFIIVIATIAVLIVMRSILEQLNRQKNLALLAFSPIVIFETGIGGHVDALAMLCVACAIYFQLRQKLFWGGCFIGLGTLFKLLPIVLLLPFFMDANNKQRVQLLAGCMTIITMGYGIALAFGLVPIGSIGTFFEKWRFGSPLFSVFQVLTGNGLLLAIPLLVITLGCVITRAKTHLWQATLWSMAIVLLLSPVQFPWYWLLVMPILTINPNRFLLVWVGLAPLTYEVLNQWLGNDLWHPATWPLVLILLGACLLSHRQFPRLVWQFNTKSRH